MKSTRTLGVAIVMTLTLGCGTDVDIGNQQANQEGGLWPGVDADQCGNGIDDNGNGLVDEGCPCSPGEVAACWPGELSARGRGVCSDGLMICPGTGEFSTWTGECHGATLPSEEVCNGIDDNCNGTVDEGCHCETPGETRLCGAIGLPPPCKAGEQICGSDGTWSVCEGAVLPQAEQCDGIDNNCNGLVDEGCDCVPEPEICGDGIDNDCNGLIDENCEVPECVEAGEWEVRIPAIPHDGGDLNSSPGTRLSMPRLAVDREGVLLVGGISHAKLNYGGFEAESLPPSGNMNSSNVFVIGVTRAGDLRFGYAPVTRAINPAVNDIASVSARGLVSDGMGGFWVSGSFSGVMITDPGKEHSASDRNAFLLHGGGNGGFIDSRAFGREGQSDQFGALALRGNELIVVCESSGFFPMDGVPLLPPSGYSRSFLTLRPYNGSYAPSRIDYASGTPGGRISDAMVAVGGERLLYAVGGTGVLNLGDIDVGVEGHGITALLTPNAVGYTAQSFITLEGYYGSANELQVNSAGNIVVSGRLRGTVSFGGPELTSGGAGPSDPFGTFIASLHADGSHRWSRAFPSFGLKAVIADDDSVYFAGISGTGSETLDLGEGPVTMPESIVVLAAYDASGALTWSKLEDHTQYKVGKIIDITDVAADGCGGFYFTGSYWMGSWARGIYLRRVVPK